MLNNQLQRTHKKAAESPLPPCLTLGGFCLASWNSFLLTALWSIALTQLANCAWALEQHTYIYVRPHDVISVIEPPWTARRFRSILASQTRSVLPSGIIYSGWYNIQDAISLSNPPFLLFSCVEKVSLCQLATYTVSLAYIARPTSPPFFLYWRHR